MSFIAQAETVVDGVAKFSEGKSDGIVFAALVLLFLAVVGYFYRQHLDKRDEREAAREIREEERIKAQHNDHIKYAERNSQALDVISEGMRTTSASMELMAKTLEKTESSTTAMVTHARRDRQAISSIIDWAKARDQNDQKRAEDALIRAQTNLIDDLRETEK